MTDASSGRPQKRALTAALAFYALVAFEFFYMASPFAAYFYGVYGPGLDLLISYPSLSWSITFFLPHIVAETQSWAVNLHNTVGAALMVLGLAAFAHAAWQIYRSKLTTPQAITAGLYRTVRHPQYLALIVAGFGMVLIWPRFLVLIAFVIMAFIYALLASVEEKLCLDAYPSYAAYRDQTGMFLPRLLEAPFRAVPRPSSRIGRGALWVGALATCMLGALAGAATIKGFTIDAIQGRFTHDAAFISVGRLPNDRLERIIDVALSDARVQAALAQRRTELGTKGLKTIAYVLPTEFYVSEVPMHMPEGAHYGHRWPANHDPRFYKVVLTEAVIPTGSSPTGRAIVSEAYNKRPIFEAHIDLSTARVAKTFPPPDVSFYRGMPVPVF